VMRVVGGSNVAAQNGLHTYQRVDVPTIASWKPDWVFTWAVPGKADQELHRWLEDPNLSQTPASQNHRVIVLKSMEVLPLSSLISGFMSEIAKATCPKE
jgi:ABC-type Fe3+-hydroxamate transport system substrate-binding protein